MAGVSAFKNAVRRRTHKERAQPYSRSKLGLLEKHKDYKLRAKDYHRKQDHINHLKSLASFKNPDEFYHNMIKSSTKDGVHTVARNNTKSTATVAKWKLQDASYLQNRLIHTTSQIDKMEACLALSFKTASGRRDSSDDEGEDGPPKPKRKKIVLPDGVTTDFLTCIEDVKPLKLPSTDAKLAKKTAAERRKLDALTKTKALLQEELQKLQLQRRLIGSKGQVKKIITEDKFGNEDPKLTVYQWKLQRAK
jgi:U3 small nucleolar RNA-associated protein 11